MSAKTIKVLEENINLHGFGIGYSFLDIILKAQAMKEKIDNFDFNQIQNFCAQIVLLRK